MNKLVLGGATMVTIVAIVFSGAIFGFFFAWVCSTLWGLDRVDPRVAIEAMNAMNQSVRNPVFFSAFFLTPIVTVIAAVMNFFARARISGALLLFASIIHIGGVIIFTNSFNLPLNDGLALEGVPASFDNADQIWREFSEPWQRYNLIRTVTSGISLALSAIALFTLGRIAAKSNSTGAMASIV